MSGSYVNDIHKGAWHFSSFLWLKKNSDIYSRLLETQYLFGVAPSSITRVVVKCHILTLLALASLTSHCGRNKVLPRGHENSFGICSLFHRVLPLTHMLTAWELAEIFLQSYSLKKKKPKPLVALCLETGSAFPLLCLETLFLEWSFSNRISQSEIFHDQQQSNVISYLESKIIISYSSTLSIRV